MKKELVIQYFDFEVFKQDWFVTFLIGDTNEYVTFRNDSLGLIDYIEKNKKETCFVGFNNKFFDNYCLKCVYNGINPYKIVNWVIVNDNKPWLLPDLQYKKNIPFFYSYDIIAGTMSSLSLKEAEGNMGMEIIEMNFDYNYGGLLKDEDYKRLLDYNKNDCLATRKLFQENENSNKNYAAKKTLIELYNLDYTYLAKTFVGLMAVILQSKTIQQQDSYYYTTPLCIKLANKSPIQNFEKREFFWTNDDFEFVEKIQNIDYKFAIGGAHGALENFKFETTNDIIIVCADVNNLYLNLMVNDKNPELQYCSRAISSPENLRTIKNKRAQYKQEGNKEWAQALKVGLVSVYGSMLMTNGNNKPSILTDWVQGRNVCITGQLALFMLAEKCATIPTATLFNLNTDGIYLTIDKTFLPKLQEVFKVWEDELKLDLEIDIIEKGKIIQKDVNNYILYNIITNEIKVKGKEVKYWQGGTCNKNSMSIIDEAIVNYFVYNKPINHTLHEAYEANQVQKFQMICNRKGKNFTKTYWGDKEVQKVNRIFPTEDTTLPSLYKLKNNSKHKFTDIPDNCYIYNGDTTKLDLKKIKLDLNYYLKLINKKIKSFIQK